MKTERSSKKKYLVITGASRGIGLETARKFQSEDYNIINISRTECPLDDSANLLIDLVKPDWDATIRDSLLSIITEADSITVVHNAAIQVHDSMQALNIVDFRRVMEVNVMAPVTLNRLLSDFLPENSSIIYVGSSLSLKATANMVSYTASKHAILGLMRSTCQDFTGTGIHTACVCPGFTKTDMLKNYGGELLDLLASKSTQKRLATPEEIAEAIYFCASNPVINGSVICADTGLIDQ